MVQISGARAFRFAAVLAAGLAMAACARTPSPEAGGGGYGSPGHGAAGGPGAVQAAPGSPQEFAVRVGDRVFFDTDSSDLNAAAQATLDSQAQWLNRYRHYSILIEGHADERGTREYNFALGARRANAVRSYLVARGVPESRLRTTSLGKERPVAVCNDISCWSQNRRAVTVPAAAGS